MQTTPMGCSVRVPFQTPHVAQAQIAMSISTGTQLQSTLPLLPRRLMLVLPALLVHAMKTTCWGAAPLCHLAGNPPDMIMYM